MRPRTSSDSVAVSLRENGADLLRYFLRRCDVAEDAADALGDLFLIAWSKRNAAPPSEAERRLWFYGIARNVLLNGQKSRRRSRAFSESLRNHITAQNSARDFTDDHADAELVRDAITGLDAVSAELVRLVHWEGLSISDAASVLNLNPSTTRGRYQAAKSALRDRLATTPEGAGQSATRRS